MRRFRLTKAAKILIVIIVILGLAGGAFAAIKTGLVDLGNDKSGTEENVTDNDVNSNETSENNNETDADTTYDISDATINLSLDEWIGWKSLVDAQNLGYYEDEGIDVNIHVINDATQSSNALIKGDLNAAGYTINRTAFLSNKFTEAGVDIVMPFITNYSNGGDGRCRYCYAFHY